jgi:hypothetical protein
LTRIGGGNYYSLAMPTNELYAAILPIIHLGELPYISFGATEQVMTLFPNKEFASRFYPDEVDGYMILLKRRADEHLTSGHVRSYEFHPEDTGDGRKIIRVIQHVAE